MNTNCEVLHIYKTSFGDVIELGFLNEVVLKPGMYLRDIHNHSWKITGVAMNNTDILLKKQNNKKLHSIWDCQIEFLEGNQILVGDKLYLFEFKD